MRSKEKLPEAPKTWEELVSLRNYLTDCSKFFLRKSKDQKKYDSDMKGMTGSEITTKIKKQMKGKTVALIINEYPHTNILQNFLKAKHYCLWSTKKSLTEKEIKDEVGKKFPSSEWFSMTRKSGYRSVPEIWHTQIYINL